LLTDWWEWNQIQLQQKAYFTFVLLDEEYTVKKEKKIYKGIQKGSGAKSYMTNDLLIYCMVKYLRISSYIRKPFLIYDFEVEPDVF
jgi:hypothetical protein